jgi:hypothetical protein
MDQSFSIENFKKILSFENRRGRNLEKEFFPEVFHITKEIALTNKKLHEHFRYRTSDENELTELNNAKTKNKNLKEQLIDKLLKEISDKVLDTKYKIEIIKVETKNKPVYTIKPTAENYFTIKQLQYNVKKSFKVTQANRFAIINQINSLLSDNFPKIVLRTDIKSFYESIPHDKLIAKINDNPALSFFSKKLLCRILKDFLIESGASEPIGIPRGIGVSAYLAELYMRDIDKELSSLENVTYYARYVDDIILVFTPTSNQKSPTYIDQAKQLLEKDTGLKMNSLKTSELDLVRSNVACELNFLGYKFQFKNLNLHKIRLTDSKMDKYKKRISNAIQEYNDQFPFHSKNARRILIHRLNFLTGNTRLENNKENVLVGIYYTNNLISEPQEDLIELDTFLAEQADAHIPHIRLRQRIKLFSFKKGFQTRKFVNFNLKTKRVTLKEILETL